MFLAIFGHGGNDIWGSGAYISKNDMAPLRTMINDGKISFHEDALIYMGTCNSGTNSGSGSFAQEIADLTGVAVIAMMNDGVAPTGNERSEDTMTYGPKLGKSGPGNFYRFEKGKDPVLIGKEVDVIQLIDQQRELENKEQ